MQITRRNSSSPVFPRTLLDEFFAEPFFAIAPLRGTMEGTGPQDMSQLALDVSETDSELVVRASLPGFAREEVQVEVHDGVLRIIAEHSEEREERQEKFHRRERRVGSLARAITLPSAVHEDKAKAELKDGVLTLRLPKHEKALPKKIAIA